MSDIELVKELVVNYRTKKKNTIDSIPEFLQPYVKEYYKKADEHFNRALDIAINIPVSFDKEFNGSVLKLTNQGITYTLNLSDNVSDSEIKESEMILTLVKHFRKVK